MISEATMKATPPVRPFTRWRRSLDGPELILELDAEQPGTGLAERIELDVRDLPNRPDLLERLTPVAREYLIANAANEPTKGETAA